jgi:hypothetical protein
MDNTPLKSDMSILEKTQKEEPRTGYQIKLRSGAKGLNNFTSRGPYY